MIGSHDMQLQFTFVDNTMKMCSKCKETKLLDMFCRDKYKKDGYFSSCKTCQKSFYEANKEKILERDKAYREANKEKITEREKAHYEANKEKITERAKAYREANKEKIAERTKAYREANKEKINEIQKAYKEANKEKILERAKAYYEANRDKHAEYCSRRRARKRKAIPKFLRNCEVERKE